MRLNGARLCWIVIIILTHAMIDHESAAVVGVLADLILPPLTLKA